MNTGWWEIDIHGCYSLVKIAFAPICASENNWWIWCQNASISRSHDVTDPLWWRHNAKSETTVLGDNCEMSERSCWGVIYWFHSVRLSVCPSVRPSVCPSRLPCPLCNIYSSGWILSILATNDHYYERVCRTQWPLTLTHIFKIIRPVASTVLHGFF